MLEVPAPAAGVLRELKVQNGATVTSGQVLAVHRGRRRGRETAAATGDKQRQPSPRRDGSRGDRQRQQAKPPSGDKLAPSVRRLVEEHQLEPAAIAGLAAATAVSPRATC